jgi:hypothetical protein
VIGSNTKDKPAFRAGKSFECSVPISRILSKRLRALEKHFSGRPIARKLKRHSARTCGTALHSGKDLAVAPSASPRRLMNSNRSRYSYHVLSSVASLFAPRGLLLAGVTRYLALLPKQKECSDFPPARGFRLKRALLQHRTLLFSHNFCVCQ